MSEVLNTFKKKETNLINNQVHLRKDPIKELLNPLPYIEFQWRSALFHVALSPITKE
jgi:hypothetical protein